MLDLTKHKAKIDQVITPWCLKAPEPEDLRQDIWVRLVEVRDQYDPTRGSLETFCAHVARSVYVSWYRYSKAQRRQVPEYIEASKGVIDTTPFEAYLRERLEFTDTAPRRVFTLLKMGYSRHEICTYLDLSLYQVNQEKARLRDLAQDYLAPA
jgi:DNA-directed RNA polymerase specialized sigma24 family protein